MDTKSLSLMPLSTHYVGLFGILVYYGDAGFLVLMLVAPPHCSGWRVQTWVRVQCFVWMGSDIEARLERFLPCKRVKIGGEWLAVEVSPAL